MIMEKRKSKIIRETKTIKVMIRMFCRGHHHVSTSNLCNQCNALAAYALERLDRCKYGEKKTACRKCPAHCYKPEYRDLIRRVMQYSGPRMLLRHPVLAIRHLMF